MKAYYADHFVLPLPKEHRFPMRKYSLLRERALLEGVLTPQELFEPPAATDVQILRCHDADYLARVIKGELTRKEQVRIGFPWSPQMVERSRRSAGATLSAAYSALEDGVSVNLAGGTHHASREHGEGYCVFNDSPIAARELQATRHAERIIIIDCDVHQGNGTAAICNGDPSIFTFSIHGEKNFPFRKVNGCLDIALSDHTTDEEYLSLLEISLERALFASKADFAIYVSGADPYVGDKLGKLDLSKKGLAQRDELVLQMCQSHHLPVAISMGGGYATDVNDIVDIHLQTIAIAKRYSKA